MIETRAADVRVGDTVLWTNGSVVEYFWVAKIKYLRDGRVLLIDTTGTAPGGDWLDPDGIVLVDKR